LDNEIDRKIDVTAILFLLDQNRHQTHDWTLIGSGANGLGKQECAGYLVYLCCNNYAKSNILFMVFYDNGENLESISF